jgi:hypothetical protein
MLIDGFKPYHPLMLGKLFLNERGKNFDVGSENLSLLAKMSELAQGIGSSS